MLKEYSINTIQSQPYGSDLFLNVSNLSFQELRLVLNKHSMMNAQCIVLRFKEHEYLDVLFEDDKVRTEFEDFLFNLIENSHKSKRFIYVVFKIQENNLDTLIHNGFYEWLDYWMLFFKFTKLNFLIEMDEDSLKHSMPIEYVITKRIDNPRTSLFINVSDISPFVTIMPEDITSFVLMVKDDNLKSTNKFPYANMWIK